MQAILSLGLGYFLGSVSPAALISKWKNVNLKKEGTKNVGATNAAILLGRNAGIFVMLFDILKSYLSAKIAKALFPQLVIAGLLAALGAIVGHCFPIFLHFEGGKGLAAFGGMVIAYKGWFFPAIVLIGMVFMAIFDTGAAMPLIGSVLFPILVRLNGGSGPELAVAAAAGLLILFMHRDNLKKAVNKQDVIGVRDFLKKVLLKKQ